LAQRRASPPPPHLPATIVVVQPHVNDAWLPNASFPGEGSLAIAQLRTNIFR